jgi:hypothetical protein
VVEHLGICARTERISWKFWCSGVFVGYLHFSWGFWGWNTIFVICVGQVGDVLFLMCLVWFRQWIDVVVIIQSGKREAKETRRNYLYPSSVETEWNQESKLISATFLDLQA